MEIFCFWTFCFVFVFFFLSKQPPKSPNFPKPPRFSTAQNFTTHETQELKLQRKFLWSSQEEKRIIRDRNLFFGAVKLVPSSYFSIFESVPENKSLWNKY
ncbi:hypothetical protein ACOSP7_029838 [Xanthoceras sorbifolium]